MSNENLDDSAFEEILDNEQYLSKAYNELYKEIRNEYFKKSGTTYSVSPEFELSTLGLGSIFKNLTVKLGGKIAIKGMTKKAFSLAVRNVLGKGSGKVIFKNVDEFLAKVPASRLNEVKNAFEGVPTLKYATNDIVLYRHCNDGAPQLSNWYTDIILSPSQAEELLALPISNKAKRIIKVKVPAGTPYIEGKVASQVNNPIPNIFSNKAIGGGQQIYFLDESKTFLQVIEDIPNPTK